MGIEFVAVRKSTIELFKTLSADSLDFEETGNNMLITPRIIGWLISGHSTQEAYFNKLGTSTSSLLRKINIGSKSFLSLNKILVKVLSTS